MPNAYIFTTAALGFPTHIRIRYRKHEFKIECVLALAALLGLASEWETCAVEGEERDAKLNRVFSVI